MSWGLSLFSVIVLLVLIFGAWDIAGDMWQDQRRWVQFIGVLMPVGLFMAGTALCMVVVSRLTE
jgi:hypothetical protein